MSWEFELWMSNKTGGNIWKLSRRVNSHQLIVMRVHAPWTLPFNRPAENLHFYGHILRREGPINLRLGIDHPILWASLYDRNFSSTSLHFHLKLGDSLGEDTKHSTTTTTNQTVCGSQTIHLQELFINMLLTHITLPFSFHLGFLYADINIYPHFLEECFVSWGYRGMHTKWRVLLLIFLNKNFEIWRHSFRISIRKLALGKRLKWSIKLFERIILGSSFYENNFLLLEGHPLSLRLAD